MNTDRFKFRIFCEDLDGKKEYLYFDLWDIQDVVNQEELRPDEIEQCTGISDKNGKLIFEGDIVAGSNGSINGVEWPYKGVVKWVIQKAEFAVPSWAYDSDGKYHGDSTHYVEIVGNIHENPEMVK